jgi:hypothetical protein
MATPGRGTVRFETLGEGKIAGLTWRLPPYRWGYDVRSIDAQRVWLIGAARSSASASTVHRINRSATDLAARSAPFLPMALASSRRSPWREH